MRPGERSWFSREAIRERDIQRKIDAEHRREDKELKKTWKFFKKRLINAFIQQQMFHVTSEKNKPTIFQRLGGRRRRQVVQLVDAYWNSTELWYRVRTEDGFLPFGVRIVDLLNPDLVKDLMGSVMRPVRIEWNEVHPDRGLWVVVEPYGSVRGLPSELPYSKALDVIPDSRPPLTYVVGATQGGKILIRDLEKQIHMFVAGTTGYGKSVFLNQLIITILLRAKPSEVQFYLFDMKNGQELQAYEGLPHVAKFIKRKDDVVDALKQINAEIERRQRMFAAKNIKNLRDWNATQPDKLPRLVLIFDELAEILLDKRYKDEVEDCLESFAATARSSGGHLVSCTQSPRSDVVTGRLKVNVPVRISFAVPSFHDSMTVLDRPGAEQLSQVGRALLRQGNELIEVQCPNLTEDMLKELLKQVRSEYGAYDGDPEVTIADLVIYALDHLEGNMPHRTLFDEFNPLGLSDPRLREMLKELKTTGFILDGKPYRVIPGKGSRPSRIVEVTQKRLSVPQPVENDAVAKRERVLKGSAREQSA